MAEGEPKQETQEDLEIFFREKLREDLSGLSREKLEEYRRYVGDIATAVENVPINLQRDIRVARSLKRVVENLLAEIEQQEK